MNKAEMAEISAQEHRILLSCDREPLMRKQVTHGYFLRSRDPFQQLIEVLAYFNLADQLRPFQRCLICNGVLIQVFKKSIMDAIPESVQES